MHEPNTGQDLLTELGYEATDVRLRPIMGALAGLAALIIVSIFGILWFYDFTSPRYAMDKGKPRWETERKLPPHPQVQALPKEEMSLFLKAQEPALAVIEKAKADMASRGIAGVTGGAAHEGFSDDYPGSGRFGGAQGHDAAEHAAPKPEAEPVAPKTEEAAPKVETETAAPAAGGSGH